MDCREVQPCANVEMARAFADNSRLVFRPPLSLLFSGSETLSPNLKFNLQFYQKYLSCAEGAGRGKYQPMNSHERGNAPLLRVPETLSLACLLSTSVILSGRASLQGLLGNACDLISWLEAEL